MNHLKSIGLSELGGKYCDLSIKIIQHELNRYVRYAEGMGHGHYTDGNQHGPQIAMTRNQNESHLLDNSVVPFQQIEQVEEADEEEEVEDAQDFFNQWVQSP